GRVSPVAGGPPRSKGPATYVQYDSAVLGRRAALTTAIRALATGFTAHPDPRSLGLRARYALQAASRPGTHSGRSSRTLAAERSGWASTTSDGVRATMRASYHDRPRCGTHRGPVSTRICPHRNHDAWPQNTAPFRVGHIAHGTPVSRPESRWLLYRGIVRSDSGADPPAHPCEPASAT